MPKSRGFTLIELMITISIIAILTTIGITTYSSVMKQGRDSKRQSDLRSIQSALEQYFADKFYYPVSLSFGSALSIDGKTYMNTLPKDPLPSPQPQYSYVPSPANCDNTSVNKRCNIYCLYAKLEGSSPGSGSCTLTDYNYAVSPP